MFLSLSFSFPSLYLKINKILKKRIVQEIEKPRNLYIQPMDVNTGGLGEGCRAKRNKGEKKIGTTVIA